jgi:hypothetical protein
MPVAIGGGYVINAASGGAIWSSMPVASKPFLIVTVNGPSDGGDYGPGTPATTTKGIQEAINACAEGGIVYVMAVNESAGGAIAIKKNMSLVSLRNPRSTGGDVAASQYPVLASLEVTSSLEQLSSVYVDGFKIAGALTIDATTNIQHATKFVRCQVDQGITIQGNQLCDFINFEDCELRQVASGNTTLFNLTNTSNSGGGGINQLFINGSLLDIEGPSGGTGYFFYCASQSQTYPQIENCSIVAKSSLTNFVMFEIFDAYQLSFYVVNCETEFLAPCLAMVECLNANQTRAYNLTGYWSAPLGTLNSGTNHLFNITSTSHTPTDLSNVIFRGYDYADGATFTPGTISASLATTINMQSFNPYGCAVTTPSLPIGTGFSDGVKNTNGFPVQIFQTGMVGTELSDTELDGTGSLATTEPSTVILLPGWTIFYGVTVPSAWKWVGLHV